MMFCNALLSSHACCPLQSQTLLTTKQYSLGETCLCDKEGCQDQDTPDEDAVNNNLIDQAIDEINSCMSYSLTCTTVTLDQLYL